MRCPSCGGVSHPATGSVLPSGEVVCGPCVRRFWQWASEHGKKTYRVGKKGKGSKYIAFPTGITKKNPAPPQPPLVDRHMMSWIQRTYAVGTPVKFVSGHPVPWSNETIPAGARGVVSGHHFDVDAFDRLDTARILVEITDARYPDGTVIDELVGRVVTIDALYFTTMDLNILDWLAPLQDNWSSTPAPIKRHALPRSQRRSSKRQIGYDPEPNALRKNSVSRDRENEIRRVFRPNLAVRSTRDLDFHFWHRRRWMRVTMPAGTIGTVGLWTAHRRAVEHLSVYVSDKRLGYGYRYYNRDNYESMPRDFEVVGPSINRSRTSRRRTSRRRSRRRASRR